MHNECIRAKSFRMNGIRIKLQDMGTPIKIGQPVSLTIDGQTLSVARGTSVMRAAAEAGIAIPKLCATDSLDAFGSCRVCLVEIEGRKGYPASCTTIVEDGMEVRTRSQRLDELRRNVVELYVSDHPLDCLDCSANGDCELQDVAVSLGVEESRYGLGENGYRDVAKDSSNPYFSFDPAQCIVCYRCVRACEDIQGTFALTVDGRGYASRVTAGQLERFMESECVSCGACVQHCPTEALVEKSVIEEGTPDRSVTTTCAYCGVGCSFHAELKDGKVLRMVPDKQGQANAGHACVKGRFAFGSRSRQHRRHYLVALHQRRDFPGAKNGARSFRQQQRRHLCAGLPFADWLRAENDAGRIGGNPGLSFRGASGRRHGHGREPQ
jgi:formate dehydrogenase major subunit